MEKELLRKQLRTCTYQLKQGTKSSYYFSGGERFLPNRVGITPDIFGTRHRSGQAESGYAHGRCGRFRLHLPSGLRPETADPERTREQRDKT